MTNRLLMGINRFDICEFGSGFNQQSVMDPLSGGTNNIDNVYYIFAGEEIDAPESTTNAKEMTVRQLDDNLGAMWQMSEDEATVNPHCVDEYFEGEGTTDNPYLISSEDKWRQLIYLSNFYPEYNGKMWKQTADITTTKWGVLLNGTDLTSPASYDGDQHTLTLDIETVKSFAAPFAVVDNSSVKNLKVTGAGYMWYLSFSQTEKNAQGGMLANANLRLAISNAIDRDNLVDNYVMDGSLATFTAVPPQFAASSTTGADFSANQDAFADYVGYNPDKAAEYFEAAKQELGKDSFSFTMIYGNNEGDEVQKVAQAIKEDIEAALPGIEINLQSMTKAERLDKMQEDNYDIALTRWGPDYADPMTYLGMWITNNSNNYGFWSNAEYDQLIADCTTGAYITDYDARWEAMF